MTFQLAGTKRLGSKVSYSGNEVKIHYDLTEGQAISITYDENVDFTEHPTGTGYFLPSSFEYLTVRHDLPYATTLTIGVHPGESPRVLSAGVSRKQTVHVGLPRKNGSAIHDGPDSIKSEGLRQIPVGRLLQDAIRAATHTAAGPSGIPELMVSEKTISEAYKTVIRGALLPRDITPGGRLGDSHYEQVAKIYRGAKGEYPTRAVKDALLVAGSTAARYVMEARRRGFLLEAPGKGLSGEIDIPTKEEK